MKSALKIWGKRTGLIFLSLMILLASLCQAQEAQEQIPPPAPVRPPVMKSIFWNTVMGSAWGAVMGASLALGDESANFRESLIFGTTFGGLIGYGFGVFLVLQGVTFDPNIIPNGPTTPLTQQPYQPDIYAGYPELVPQPSTQPRIRLHWEQQDGKKALAVEATLFDWHF